MPRAGFPADAIFERLVQNGVEYPEKRVVRDAAKGIEASTPQLLADVLALREAISDRLDAGVLKTIEQGKTDVFICILAPGGYEFIVAFLAVLALGAAAVPLSVTTLPEEGEYFISLTRAVALVTDSTLVKLGDSIEQAVAAKAGHTSRCPNINIKPHRIHSHSVQAQEPALNISPRWSIDSQRTGLAIFTSGTTGRPKAVLHSRATLWLAAQREIEWGSLTDQDLILQQSPTNWAGGLVFILPFILVGATIEPCVSVFTPAWFWKRVKQGDITYFCASPAIYARLASYLNNELASLDPERKDEYIAGIRKVRILATTSAPLPDDMKPFWASLRQGLPPLIDQYASTETFGACIRDSWASSSPLPHRCVGEFTIGVQAKLSNGDEGELLLNAPWLLTGYLSPTKIPTDCIFDAEGFFKTGDLARREGNRYFIYGRISADIIRFATLKVNAVDVEEQILRLPYVSDAVVVGVDDDEHEERVAALLSLNPSSAASVSLQSLREDLAASLPVYTLPTLLRVLKGPLPRVASGKISKVVVKRDYFPQATWNSDTIEVWDVNAELHKNREEQSLRPFDWADV